MEPVSFLLGLLVLTGCFSVGVRVTSDAFATARAAKAGQWDLIDRDRQRRASRGERWAAAWHAVRARRHRQAGGTGEYRPGFGAYAADVYHGFWEDQITRRQANRAARPGYEPDPNRRRWHERVDEAVIAKVSRLREAWRRRQPGYVPQHRVSRTSAKPAESSATPVEPVAHEPGTWTVDADGHRVPLAPTCDPGPADRASAADAEELKAGVRRAIATELARRAALSPEEAAAEEEWRARVNAAQIEKERERARQLGIPYDCVPQPVQSAATADGSNDSTTTSTDEGESTMGETDTTPAAGTATEVQTNEDARRNFQAMADAAAEAADALVALEVARAKMVAASQATADGMSAKAFDTGATAAANEAADAIGLDTLGGWAEKIDAVRGAADKGLAGLDKYRDAEAQVAEERIDPTTLAATSS
jgi:hypothetical protein